MLLYDFFAWFFFFFKQKTAYEISVRDWSSDVCSSDLVPGSADEGEEAAVRRILAGHRITILLERTGTTWGDALGPRGRVEEPRFWQLALLAPGRAAVASRALYEAGVEIERLTASTVVSLSRHTAVYKLRGGPDALLPYFDDLRHERFATSMAFGHDRYATNTSTSFERVQPFAAFAHNGEIRSEERRVGKECERL